MNGSDPAGSRPDGRATAAVEARGVSKVFGSGVDEVRALDAVSVTIRENEFFTLLGPSGCGKTTLLRLIAGFEQPTDGTILLHGEDITGKPPYQRAVNTVFQSYALFPHLTVAENIGFGLEMQGRPRAEITETVDRMLAMVRMEAMRNRRTGQISGGQQQRVALARALAPRPRVLLLDEPLSALDLKLRKEMQIELKRLQHETGITFIFVTHDQEEALTMSDRIAVMRTGHILQIGSPRDVYDQPANRFVADFIGETNFLKGTVEGSDGNGVRVALDAGGSVTAAGRAAAGAITIAVRPENVTLGETGAGDGTLRGRITNAVYSGTDTHIHLALASGETLVARVRDGTPEAALAAEGAEVAIGFVPGRIQVMAD